MTAAKDDQGAGGISRREFVTGMAAGVALQPLIVSQAKGAAASLAAVDAATSPSLQPSSKALLELDAANYPPLKTGLRGQYPGSFEIAHAVRDGAFSGPVEAQESGEHYDLVVVGAGISGLAAAYFYRKALGADKRILLLDNHDDFGGHAKRNEFHHEGRVLLAYGGTQNTHSPFPYSHISLSLLAELGVDTTTYSKYAEPDVYAGLQQAMFFDREHFVKDKLVVGYGTRPWKEFFADAPLTRAVRADLVRLYSERVDYLPDLDPMQKAEALRRITYQDFLLKHARLLPESLPYFRGMIFRNSMRVDTVPAYLAALSGAPGFSGMNIEKPIEAHSAVFTFPDGNATIARLLVNRLVPGVFGGATHNMESIILAKADYSQLDLPTNPVRIRLQSPVVRVEHLGTIDSIKEKAVRVVYTKDGKTLAVTAANVVMACFNNIVRHLVPELPEEQKTAVTYASKVPLMYTNVVLRNWRPWKRLGVHSIVAPNGYHTALYLDRPISIGGFRSVLSPDEPVVLHMMLSGSHPGTSRREQNRIVRAEMLATPYEKIEAEIRSQLQRVLGPAGFDARKDILAITANRWPHGYAYTYDSVGDPDMPPADRPHVIGRKPFGRIAIANSDAGASAFTNVAIDEAHRAIQECLISRGLT